LNRSKKQRERSAFDYTEVESPTEQVVTKMSYCDAHAHLYTDRKDEKLHTVTASSVLFPTTNLFGKPKKRSFSQLFKTPAKTIFNVAPNSSSKPLPQQRAATSATTAQAAPGSGKKEKEAKLLLAQRNKRRQSAQRSSSSSSSSSSSEQEKKKKNKRKLAVTAPVASGFVQPKTQPALREKKTSRRQPEPPREPERTVVRPVRAVTVAVPAAFATTSRRRTQRRCVSSKVYVLLGTDLTEEQTNWLATFASLFNEQASAQEAAMPSIFSVVDTFSSEVTHVITSTPRGEVMPLRTHTYFQGLLKGLYVMTFDWIAHALASFELKEEESYVVKGDACAMGGADRARSILTQNSAGDRLFENLNFLLSPADTWVTPPQSYAADGKIRTEVLSLITTAGGKIQDTYTKNSPHRWFAVSDPQDTEARARFGSEQQADMNRVSFVTPDFIFKCISEYTLLKAQKN
jgi:hypothetical protein